MRKSENTGNKNKCLCLARWLGWLEPCPVQQKAACCVPGQGVGGGNRSTPLSHISLPLSLSHQYMYP